MTENAYNLSGFGCPDCGGGCMLGAVANFDTVKIGGNTYSVDQVIDKTLIAKVDTKVYSRPGGTLLTTIKAGQPIGVVYSYLKPSQTADGRTWLSFDKGYNEFYFAPDEAASSEGLKDQGAKTVAEQTKEAEESQQKDNDPVGYYLKKYGLPALLIIGGIVVVGGIAKEAVKSALTSKTATT